MGHTGHELERKVELLAKTRHRLDNQFGSLPRGVGGEMSDYRIHILYLIGAGRDWVGIRDPRRRWGELEEVGSRNKLTGRQFAKSVGLVVTEVRPMEVHK